MQQHPAFHFYSLNGTASGQLVYAHYGRSADYAALAKANVSVAGRVVLVRGGHISLPAKVVLAHEAGAVAILTYE